MKNIFALFSLFFTSWAHGFEICGPSVNGTDYAYTNIASTNGMSLGNWANGQSCTTDTDLYNISQMCETIVVGGEAFCASMYYWPKSFDETTATLGAYCWCRRTKMLVDGQLADSIGQWVLIGGLGDSATCQSSCARICADNVANNTNYMRNAIMLLPAF